MFFKIGVRWDTPSGEEICKEYDFVYSTRAEAEKHAIEAGRVLSREMHGSTEYLNINGIVIEYTPNEELQDEDF